MSAKYMLSEILSNISCENDCALDLTETEFNTIKKSYKKFNRRVVDTLGLTKTTNLLSTKLNFAQISEDLQQVKTKNDCEQIWGYLYKGYYDINKSDLSENLGRDSNNAHKNSPSRKEIELQNYNDYDSETQSETPSASSSDEDIIILDVDLNENLDHTNFELLV